jgi:YD repeat-containing protein
LLLALCVAPALAATVFYVYDKLGRLVAAIDPQGETTIYSYDAAGNLLSVARRSSSQVVIVSFAPDHGKPGDSVTIFGSGFIADPVRNTVSFNGTPASVTSAAATAIVALVPAGATTGPIGVSNANGSAVSAQAFTVVEPPTIAGVTPSLVARGFITRVQILGTNLRYSTAVTFAQAGITAGIVPNGATQTSLAVDLRVSASVPPGAYPFTVSNPAGSTNSGAVTVTVGVSATGDIMVASAPVSVFVGTGQAAPTSGDSQSVSPAMSVFMPLPAQAAPTSGDSQSVSPATSVFVPLPVQAAPTSGDSQSVSPTVSVSMP